MLDAPQKLKIEVLNKAIAKAYSFTDKKTGLQVEGVSANTIALCEDKDGSVTVLSLKIGKCPDSYILQPGKYEIVAPTNYFKKLIAGIWQLNFAAGSELVSLTAIK